MPFTPEQPHLASLHVAVCEEKAGWLLENWLIPVAGIVTGPDQVVLPWEYRISMLFCACVCVQMGAPRAKRVLFCISLCWIGGEVALSGLGGRNSEMRWFSPVKALVRHQDRQRNRSCM